MRLSPRPQVEINPMGPSKKPAKNQATGLWPLLSATFSENIPHTAPIARTKNRYEWSSLVGFQPGQASTVPPAPASVTDDCRNACYVNSEVAAIGASVASSHLGVAPAAWPVANVRLMALYNQLSSKRS